MITFEQNLTRLLSLKQQAQTLINTYNKDISNITHLRSLEEKIKQLRTAHIEIEHLKQQQSEEQIKFSKQLTQHIQKVESTKIELLLSQEEKNTRDQEIERYKQLLKDKDDQIRLMDQDRTKLENKFKRDIDNLNLMHNQELYILKKKENNKK